MLQQLIYLFGSLVLLPFLPLLLFFGQRVRRRIPELPEASEHITGHIPGTEPALHILTLGESTIAGVGVTDHEDGIVGALARELHEWSGKAVYWQVLARNGYTAEKVDQKLVPRVPAHALDLIVIGLGGNDTFQFNSPLTFRKHLKSVLTHLRERQPNTPIIIANMPPVYAFPAFPWYMQAILGGLVQLHGAVIRNLPQQFEGVYYMHELIRLDNWVSRAGGKVTVDDFFSDGVHPSKMTYTMWGQEIGVVYMQNIARFDASLLI